MSKRVVLSGSAKKKLEKLLEYLETEWSGRVRDEFIQKLDHAISAIRSNPHGFPESMSIKDLHKCLVTKQNALYYRIGKNQIEIVTFFDSRQD